MYDKLKDIKINEDGTVSHNILTNKLFVNIDMYKKW